VKSSVVKKTPRVGFGDDCALLPTRDAGGSLPFGMQGKRPLGKRPLVACKSEIRLALGFLLLSSAGLTVHERLSLPRLQQGVQFVQVPYARSMAPPGILGRKLGRVRAVAANAGLGGSGWKRTLPLHIYRAATWFDEERTLAQIYRDVDVGGIVWLTFANSAFRDLTLNWVAHLYGLRKERAMAVAALDRPFQQLLLEERLPFFAFDHGMQGDLRSNVSGFRRLGALKGTLVLSVLRSERHVLLSDVDVVWLADPTPILASLARHADVMSATDCLHVTDDERKFPRRPQGTNRCAYNPGNADGHAAFNTGVVYFRPSKPAKAFAAAWRARLVSVEPSSWVDDQLAFNELVWHGFRNHPDRSIASATHDGKVITVRMGNTANTAAEQQQHARIVAGHQQCPNPVPTPAWIDGWNSLVNKPGQAWVDDAVDLPTISRMPLAFTLAPLPARHFCSGHLYWEQQSMEAHNCSSVHTTFVEGGNPGKLWRLKEAGLWRIDPPSHYDPPGGGRYLRFEPPHAPRHLQPVRNTSASARYDDKYKAGWLAPSAINLSPRLRQHLELMRRHFIALRDAMAIAVALKRVLILPRLPCLCDRSEGPSVLRECRYEASELPSPFVCPLTHLLDIYRLGLLRGWLDYRESSFIDSPLIPSTIREGEVQVEVFVGAANSRGAAATNSTRMGKSKSTSMSMSTSTSTSGTGAGPGTATPPIPIAHLASGSSDAQITHMLAEHAESPLLSFSSTEGVFGGWSDPGAHLRFEQMMRRSSVFSGSWCCSSWYKPSGSINFARPAPTVTLPSGCGLVLKATVESQADCQKVQQLRRQAQAPIDFVYEPAPGPDGYWSLRGQPV